MITQNGEANRDLLLSVTDRKASAPGGHSPARAPLTTHLLHYYQSLSRPAIGFWLRKKVSTLIGYLLTDGLSCLTVKYLADWHLEEKAAVLKLVSFPAYLGCYALHNDIMYVSILYTLYIQIVC